MNEDDDDDDDIPSFDDFESDEKPPWADAVAAAVAMGATGVGAGSQGRSALLHAQKLKLKAGTAEKGVRKVTVNTGGIGGSEGGSGGSAAAAELATALAKDDDDPSLLAKDVSPGECRPGILEAAAETGEIFIIGTQGTKVTRISGISHLTELRVLALRSNLITKIRGIRDLVQLQTLELYDNRIEHIRGLDTLVLLERLDLTHNAIGELKGLSALTRLRELYVASNQLEEIPEVCMCVCMYEWIWGVGWG